MAIAPITPRDRVQQLGNLAAKTWRYAWLPVVFSVAGTALAVGFAMTRPKSYQSWATLFYQEQIQSQLLTANREEANLRGIGDRYRELLLAHEQLEQILDDPKLNPFPGLKDDEIAIDKLRALVHFESRGANTFRITFTDADPDRAKAVTEKLTELLQQKEDHLRKQQAEDTLKFATLKANEASAELRKRQQDLAEFLAKHPEFVADQGQSSTGAGIKAYEKGKSSAAAAASAANPKLFALLRQRERIQARLDAPPGAMPVVVPAPPTPEKIAAQAAVNDAQRDVTNAQKALDSALQKYTDKHPAAMAAKTALDEANTKLKHAEAAVPPDVELPARPATAEDRAKLQKDLQAIDAQIAAENKADKDTGSGSAAAAVSAAKDAADQATNWIVQLETQHADLERRVSEQAARTQSLAEGVFRSQIDADTKEAETGGRLAIVDPAFKPVKPTGPGKAIFVMGGFVLFSGLGAVLAILLAVIDDRLYRRVDLDQLGIPALAVIPPPEGGKRGKLGRSGPRRARHGTAA
ncbi:MAG TPA: hypothetical protein VGM88_24240 [Kofleriaceae bacterium]|jgi:capsular polysaccharide biosynthesis protein